MAVTDEDLFHDEDLLDFEDPKDREVVAARMRRQGNVPGAVSGARALLYLQLLMPIVIPFVVRALRDDDGPRAADAAATTTTTVAQEGARRGGGGGGLIVVLGVLVFLTAILVIATKLGKGSPGARYGALGLEGLVLLFAARGLAGGQAAVLSAVLGVFAVAIVGLLLSPQARKMSVNPVAGDSSARFDVRNLPGLDR